MTSTIRDAILDKGYALPPYANMHSKTQQKNHLVALHAIASAAHSHIQCHEQDLVSLIHHACSNKSNGLAKILLQCAQEEDHQLITDTPSPSSVITATASTYLQSSAETVLHWEHGKKQPSTPIICPTMGYVSKYHSDFHGCFGCVHEHHTFHQCPQRNDKNTLALFHKEFKLHKLFWTKCKVNSLTQYAQSNPTASPITAHAANPPSPTSPPPKHQVTFTPSDLKPNPKSVPCLFTQIDGILQTATCQNHAMPIPVNNHLPTFNLHLRQDDGGCVDLGCLFDSCAAISSGYKPFHWHLMCEFPSTIHSYEEFNDANPFEPIKLARAIRDPANLMLEICSELTAVVHYFTPFTCTDGSPCVISFALSDSVNVNTILGWPTISQLQMNLLVTTNEIHSSVLQHHFPLAVSEPCLGLPVTTHPDCTTTQRPPPIASPQTTSTTQSSLFHTIASNQLPLITYATTSTDVTTLTVGPDTTYLLSQPSSYLPHASIPDPQ